MELSELFPGSPHMPELTRLTFANGNPDDYQSTIEVGAEDFPVYLAAPRMLEALRQISRHECTIGRPSLAASVARGLLAELNL